MTRRKLLNAAGERYLASLLPPDPEPDDLYGRRAMGPWWNKLPPQNGQSEHEPEEES